MSGRGSGPEPQGAIKKIGSRCHKKNPKWMNAWGAQSLPRYVQALETGRQGCRGMGSVAAQSRLATYTTFKTEAALHRCTRYYAVLSVAISGGLNRARRELLDVALGKGIAILLPARPVRSLLKADRRRASKACQSGRRFIVRKPCARDHIPGDLFSLIVLGADFVRGRFRCSPIAPECS